MKRYSVAEIAQLFSVSQETVRRWIRLKTGGLKAQSESRREGFYVEEKDLQEFLDSSPQYHKYATILRGQRFVDSTLKKIGDMSIKDHQREQSPLEILLEQQIASCSRRIREKETEIEGLKVELAGYQKLLNDLKVNIDVK